MPGLKPARIPVNPGDPIAIVNNQIISRQQLADECLAREGKKVLELLINRTLIDQALRGKKLEITAAEIDQEIEIGRPAVRDHAVRAGCGPSTRNAESARSSTPATSSIPPSRCGNCARAECRSLPTT